MGVAAQRDRGKDKDAHSDHQDMGSKERVRRPKHPPVGSPVWTWSQSDARRGPVLSEVLRVGRWRELLHVEDLRLLMTGLDSTHSLPGARGLLSPDDRVYVSYGALVPSGQWTSLTIVIHQPEAVMDPIVGLFSPRLLQGQGGEDAPVLQPPHQPSSLTPPFLPPFHPFTPLSPLLHHLSIRGRSREPSLLLVPTLRPAEPTSLSLGPFPRSQ